MQILIRSILLSIILIFLFTSIEIDAQPPFKAKERIKQMKKMKLLDVLNLSEDEADKFIVKYSSWENKVEGQKEEVDKISDELFDAIKNDASTEELQKLSKKLLEAQEKFFSLQLEKLKAMKEILNDKNYAKYLVFEDRFIKELGKMMMERGRGGKGGGGGGGRMFRD